jgi:exosortase D (VPLPA-CTERM-specific)
MASDGISNTPAAGPDPGRVLEPGLFLLVSVILFLTFREGVTSMAAAWGEPEYSHGYLIPFISLYLLAIRVGRLQLVQPSPSWLGAGVVLVALLGFLLGELSALYVIVQYSFVVAVWGLIVTQVGWRGVKVLWPVLVFMLFMVPLPRFLQWNLSNEMQLISSELGALMLRAMGVAVYLEGNVIDLGAIKLQVVEACSGLRYMFPLMCFGLLCSILYKGRFWQRALIFLSSIPIAILMNSFRIAVTGVLVNAYGNEAAEGFLHYFEGWVIFTLCLVLMFAEMTLLARLAGRPLDEVFDVELPDRTALAGLVRLLQPNKPLLVAAGLLVLGAAASFVVANREEITPKHVALATFPLSVGDWRGTEGEVPREQLEELKLTDYIIASYQSPGEPLPVELYVAFYDSQRKGASIHSPKACLPGGGWQIKEFGQVVIPGAGLAPGGLTVNRTLITLGEQRSLVYYWFMQRGRVITNEYLAKWYIFWDSLTMQRTDGALVRIVTPVLDAAAVEAGDARIAEFIRQVDPRLNYHIPGKVLVP